MSLSSNRRKWWLSLLVVSVLLLPNFPSAALGVADDVVFEGSGWGHGVGMSQYGAWGMAVQGSSHGMILGHYYQGADVAQAVNPQPIWVNLERDFVTKTLTVGNTGEEAGTPVSIVSSVGSLEALSGAAIVVTQLPPPPGSTYPGCAVAVTNPSQPVVSLNDPLCSFDFSWYDWMTEEAVPSTKLTISGCTNTDWNVAPSIARPCAYALGMLHLRTGVGGLDLSVELSLDDYVLGTSEMPYYWIPTEALKAQAVASRAYGHAKQLERGDPATNSCDGWCHVKDSTDDQRYVGWGHGAAEPWVAAVQATAGEVLHHDAAPNGVVTAFFSSSTGGATENVEERLGGPPRPYLISVDDSVAIDGTVPNSKANWTTSVSAASIASALQIDTLLKVEVIDRRTSGSAWHLKFTGIDGGSAVAIETTGTWVRNTFGLFSEYFDVEYEAWPPNASDEMFFYGSSSGVFAYFDVDADASLGSAVRSGAYSVGWSSITAIDLEGDGRDEQLFYRSSDGTFKYYGVTDSGSLVGPIRSGVYSKGWDVITAVDLEGDGQDEQLFYRSSDGTFKYYRSNPDGSLGALIKTGAYSTAWTSITGVQID